MLLTIVPLSTQVAVVVVAMEVSPLYFSICHKTILALGLVDKHRNIK
jgi:hypothetical protein